MRKMGEVDLFREFEESKVVVRSLRVVFWVRYDPVMNEQLQNKMFSNMSPTSTLQFGNLFPALLPSLCG